LGKVVGRICWPFWKNGGGEMMSKLS
jgi:hypothetical protein